MNKVDVRPQVKVRAIIQVATPVLTGLVEHEYVTSLVLAAQQCALQGIFLEPIFAPRMSLVEYARNWLFKQYLDRKPATHLMWLDADLGFDADAILRMYAADKDVIAGVYPTKSEDASIFPYMALGPVDEKGLQLAEIVPGGFVMMKRRVAETLAERCDEWHEIECDGRIEECPRVFDLRMDGKKLVGEDYILCERIRRAGFQIHVLPNINFSHFGTKAWRGNLAKQLAKEAEYNAANETQLGQGVEAAHKHNAAHAADIDARVAAGTLKG